MLGIEEDVFLWGTGGKSGTIIRQWTILYSLPRFEGLPGTVVEAQAAGLKCIISDKITPEVGFTELVAYKDIALPAEDWAKQIMNDCLYERKNMCQAVESAGFDVREQARRMESFYLSGKIG